MLLLSLSLMLLSSLSLSSYKSCKKTDNAVAFIVQLKNCAFVEKECKKELASQFLLRHLRMSSAFFLKTKSHPAEPKCLGLS